MHAVECLNVRIWFRTKMFAINVNVKECEYFYKTIFKELSKSHVKLWLVKVVFNRNFSYRQNTSFFFIGTSILISLIKSYLGTRILIFFFVVVGDLAYLSIPTLSSRGHSNSNLKSKYHWPKSTNWRVNAKKQYKQSFFLQYYVPV